MVTGFAAVFVVLLLTHTPCNSFECHNQCEPANVTQSDRCSYIQTCCSDALGDGTLVNYLSLQYCTFETLEPLGIAVLSLLVLYAFLILGNVADDYFAPTMEEIAEFLNVSHELAGVTFVAFGNGAPDISSAVAAITQSSNTTKLGLGALLGAAVFVPIAVSGAIAIIVDYPKVARRPFLRDCFFLFTAAGFILFITTDGIVTLAESIGMVAIYVCYVGSVLLGEVYTKWRRKKRREEKAKVAALSRPDEPTKIADKLMPFLGAFSNDSIRDLFRTHNHENGHSPQVVPTQRLSLQQNQDPLQNAPPMLYSRQISAASMSEISRQSSSEIPYIQDLYHRLQREAGNDVAEDADSVHLSSSDGSRNSPLDDRISASNASQLQKNANRNRKWCKTVVVLIIRGPTLVLEVLCKLTIPMTDAQHWNDYLAMLCCITSPIFIQFAFFPDSLLESVAGCIPIVAVVGACGLLLCVFTAWRIHRKYQVQKDLRRRQPVQPRMVKKSLLDDSDLYSSHVGVGVDVDADEEHAALYASLPSNLSSLPPLRRPSSHSIQKLSNAHDQEHVQQQQTVEKEIFLKSDQESRSFAVGKPEDLCRKPVMKLFFLGLSFLSAVAWIELIANELVNLLTTLGIISTIDLALLGLTVLAWGNSVGDMISDVSVSRRGYAKMGISAAIGGPTLNVFIGVGLGTLINTLSSPHYQHDIPDTSNIFVCCVAVMLGIAVYAVWTALSSWTLTRKFGYFCFIYYFTFIAVNILVYKQIIKLPFGS